MGSPFNEEKVKEIAEKSRRKGGFLRGPPEEIRYIKLVYWPYIYFEYSYIKKVGFIKKKEEIFSSSSIINGIWSTVLFEDELQNKISKAFQYIFPQSLYKLYQKNPPVETEIEGKGSTLNPLFSSVDTINYLIDIYNRFVDVYNDAVERAEELLQEAEIHAAEARESAEREAFWREQAQLSRSMKMRSFERTESAYAREYREQAKEAALRASKLEKRAKRTVEEAESRLKKVKSEIYKGLHLDSKVRLSDIRTITDELTFFVPFWIIKYESKKGARYLVIGEPKDQTRIIEGMLIHDYEIARIVEEMY